MTTSGTNLFLASYAEVHASCEQIDTTVIWVSLGVVSHHSLLGKWEGFEDFHCNTGAMMSIQALHQTAGHDKLTRVHSSACPAAAEPGRSAAEGFGVANTRDGETLLGRSGALIAEECE